MKTPGLVLFPKSMQVNPKLDCCCVLCNNCAIWLNLEVFWFYMFKKNSEKLTLNMCLIVHTVSLSYTICQSPLCLVTFFFSTLNCERTHVWALVKSKKLKIEKENLLFVRYPSDKPRNKIEIIVLCRIWRYEGLRLAMADMPITLYSGQTMLQIMTGFLLHS